MDPLEGAVKELGERNYGSAIRTLEMLTARDPSNADAWKHLFRAYHETGQREQAAEAAQRYSALRPTDASGHYNAGVLLAGLGQAEAAVRALRSALAADPGHAKARRALAKLEGVDAETGEPVAALPAAVAAKPAEDVRRKMPWQAKVAAALTVVAALAILLWLFLPGGRARRGAPTQNPQPSPSAIATPPPDQATANQPNDQMTPTPDQQPRVQPLPEGTAPLGSAEPGAGTARPGTASRSSEAAREALRAIQPEAQQQFMAQLGLVLTFLRDPRFQEDMGGGITMWDVTKAAFATQGLKMVPGGASVGEAEIAAIIANAPTSTAAATELERRTPGIVAASWQAFAAEGAAVVTAAASPEQAVSGLLPILRKHSVNLTPPAMDQLQRSIDGYFARQAGEPAAQATR
jgi:tetratricopeptide (TPR) repeat protein